ncbi:hypothetical protein T459_21450 [Capsicum annuum]|uniref:Leucine-rich repeat-containing N-terminal plant-type domain-containing protein n=1 Tax=Capsicum annuum TaxID=4072 RepID=A0A1U8DRQ6_CAPAN|nr:receptor protein kinase-like protein At4g34220 [Capsicum annuum]XP_016537700.1 receptor protein kinase-like protein At4g34220 [Capsicum annuum]KAF3668528.1 putative stress enhanced protein 1, chloroplastic-like isoform X1 [Capsicum annuum]PHT74173.1 hypothetical protein T459_21450 [Capsicum annuum]
MFSKNFLSQLFFPGISKFSGWTVPPLLFAKIHYRVQSFQCFRNECQMQPIEKKLVLRLQKNWFIHSPVQCHLCHNVDNFTLCVLSFGVFFFLLWCPSFGLNIDGTLLLSFKYSILDDPLSVLDNWEYNDATPCLWNGVTYAPDMIIQVLSLSNNDVNGVLPESVGGVKEPKGSKSFCQCICWKSAFVGNLPQKSSLQNLAVVSLRNNHFSGIVPSGFQFIEVLDLSSNFLNGTLPAEFGGDSLKYLTSFQTSLSGLVSSQFSKKIPPNATIDLSFNSLTAEIPESVALSNQKI